MAQRLQGLRILVADDDALCCDVAQALLEIEGAQIRLARNGAEAAATCLEGGPFPDLVLIDNEMPILTGLEATRLIRRRFSPASLPIIGLSSRYAPQDRAAATQAGMNDYLCKPFDLEQVVQAVLHCMIRDK